MTPGELETASRLVSERVGLDVTLVAWGLPQWLDTPDASGNQIVELRGVPDWLKHTVCSFNVRSTEEQVAALVADVLARALAERLAERLE